ncbi:phage distal tail protein [Viridibacillus arvi]|uniref:phage distal tail protein n=1 Tax=Viridibacillus arvi TaxID=263475 RepID=UPI00187B8000|nr:phage tail domain-containing protein [Viridibacillus sp. JNUCC-6]QOV10941.1 phage tail family protein [Viridibacillus sp. JNUCC-6]
METITFTNSRGETVKFGGPPFYLQSVTGLGDVTAQIQKQKSPFQDGSTFLDALLDEREVEITFLIVADLEQNYGDVSKARARIAQICNPKLGPGILKYENDYVVRIIDAIASHVPIYGDNGERTKTLQKSTISFIAHDPYWKSLKVDEEPAFKPLFQFPFSGPFQMGIQRDERIIENDGDSETPIFVEFFGPAKNPQIINETTGQFVKVNQNLLEGERMIIDTSEDNKSVFFVNELGESRNVFHWIDLGSTFFKLVIGENKIKYSADSDIQGAILNISYNKRYNAV